MAAVISGRRYSEFPKSPVTKCLPVKRGKKVEVMSRQNSATSFIGSYRGKLFFNVHFDKHGFTQRQRVICRSKILHYSLISALSYFTKKHYINIFNILLINVATQLH